MLVCDPCQPKMLRMVTRALPRGAGGDEKSENPLERTPTYYRKDGTIRYEPMDQYLPCKAGGTTNTLR